MQRDVFNEVFSNRRRPFTLRMVVQIENQTIEANLAALMEKMEKCLLAQKRFATDPIEIICEPEVKWEHLAKIYNMFFGAGLTDITFQMTE